MRPPRSHDAVAVTALVALLAAAAAAAAAAGGTLLERAGGAERACASPAEAVRLLSRPALEALAAEALEAACRAEGRPFPRAAAALEEVKEEEEDGDGDGGDPCSDRSGLGPLSAADEAEFGALRRLHGALGGRHWLSAACWPDGGDGEDGDGDEAGAGDTARRACNGEGGEASSWSGVVCRGGRVRELRLGSNAVRGEAAAVLRGNWTGLEALDTLDLESNALSGELPREVDVAGWPALRWLSLASNGVGGTMPAVWRGVGALEHLNVHQNAISGTVPSEYRGLGRLQYLSFSYNALTGTAPSVFRGLDALESLFFRNNALSGTMPRRLVGVPRLGVLTYTSNRVSGELPAAYEGFGNVTTIELRGTLISGTLPARFEGLDNLSMFVVKQTKISGTLPPGMFASLPSIGIFDALEAPLSGTLPADFTESRSLQRLGLSRTAISGSLPERITGLPNLEIFTIGATMIGGTLPAAKYLLSPKLFSFTADRTLISGTLPPSGWTSPGSHKLELFLNNNHGISGPVPHRLLQGVVKMECEQCSLSGTLEHLEDADVASLAILRLSGNSISGSLPRALLMAPLLNVLALSENSLSAIADVQQPLPSARLIVAESNQFAGTLPRSLCQLPGSLHSLSLANNSLSGVVLQCLNDLRGLRRLDLSQNRLTRVERGFAGRSPSLAWLSLAGNPLSGAAVVALTDQTDGSGVDGGGSSLRHLDLSSCQLHAATTTLMRSLLVAFPRLSHLSLASSGIYDGLRFVANESYSITSLDVSGNPYYVGSILSDTTDNTDALAVLEALDVSNTDVPGIGMTLPWLKSVSMSAPLPDTEVSRHTARKTLQSISVVGTVSTSSLSTPTGHLSRKLLLPRLVKDTTTVVRYSDPGADLAAALLCPRWSTVASGAPVDADPDFLRGEQCRCSAEWRFDRADRACVPCPALEGLECDPYVLAPRHCLSGNVYPVAADGGVVALASALADAAAVLRCRRPGLCNTGASASAACGEAAVNASLHTNEHEDEAEAPLAFGCDAGHDPASLLCSRCAEGHWPNGGACLSCAAWMRWAVPAVMAVAVAGAVAYLVVRSARRDRGERTASLLLYWLQLSSLLEMSSQVHAGNRGSSVWPWLASARASAESWAVVRPWAARCVWGGADYADGAAAVLLAPYVVAAAAAVAALVVPARVRPRVAYVAWWLELSLLFPVAVHALAPFSCVSAPGGAYLDAAPYLRCGGAAVARLRVLGGVALGVYVVPLVAACAWISVRWRGSGGGGSGGGSGGSGAQLDGNDLAAPLMELPEMARRESSDRGVDCDDDEEDHDGAAATPLGPYEAVAHRILLSAVRDPAAHWWWPVAHDLGQKLLLALALGLTPVASPMLPAAVFGVVAVAVVAHVWARPWRAAGDNLLETVVLVAALAVYLLNIVVGAASVAQGHVSESTQTLTRALVSTVYLAVVGCVVAVVVRRRKLGQ